MRSRIRRSGAVAILVFFSTTLCAQDEKVGMQDIRKCRQISEAEARLACYDRLGEPATSGPGTTAAEQPAQEAPGTVHEDVTGHGPGYRELTEDVGLPKAIRDDQVILATVSRCGEANNRRFYFYFDNGQIWKYVGGRKLRIRDCSKPATLREDRFGFTLQLDGDARSMRVERVK